MVMALPGDPEERGRLWVLLAGIVTIALLVGCYAPPIEKVSSGNPEVTLNHIVTTPEGCKVYRFADGHDRYVAVCPANADGLSVSGRVGCGKNCTRDESISTVRARE
jgi:hypothetical protein